MTTRSVASTHIRGKQPAWITATVYALAFIVALGFALSFVLK